ncbi:MAG: hypothetical protein JSS82_16640 [Bacteroidetes bacterium]|nr:hypothetical protein [Bacteroidota bacterium]
MSKKGKKVKTTEELMEGVEKLLKEKGERPDNGKVFEKTIKKALKQSGSK